MKTLIKNFLFLTVPTLLIIFLLLELTFRFVMPASNGPDYAYDTTYQLIHFDNTRNAKGLYTFGKFAQERGEWSVNNFGWNSPYDYTKERTKKLRIAVIGDSFIEGLNVNNTSIYPFKLQSLLGNSAEVYAFGISGAPMSQYLNMSRYVHAVFNPDILIINIVHNDFDESLKENQTLPYFKTLDITDSILTEMPPEYYQLSFIKRTIKRSALVRYFYLNLQLNFDAKPKFQDKGAKEFNANIDVTQASKQQAKIQTAVDYIFKKLREENEGKQILIVMDGPRNNIYSGTTSKSNVLFLNEIAKNSAAHRNLHFIDLTAVFEHDYAQNKKKFNADIDFHWNEYGHQVVADTVYKFLKQHQ